MKNNIDSIIKLFEIDLLEDKPDEEEKIPSELLPFVFEKLCIAIPAIGFGDVCYFSLRRS